MPNLSVVVASSLLAFMSLCPGPPPQPTTPPPPPSCGALDEVCCERQTGSTSSRIEYVCDDASLTCTSGRCRANPGSGACGGPFQTCCAGSVCTTDFASGNINACQVETNVCYACGGSGERCCPDGRGLPICQLSTDSCADRGGGPTCGRATSFP